MGKVYLIKCYNDIDVSYKIGFTRGKSIKRLKGFDTGNPNDLEIVHEFETKYNTMFETNLHHRFKSKRGKGEWFNLDLDDVKNFIETCKSIERNFDILAESNYHFKKLLNIK